MDLLAGLDFRWGVWDLVSDSHARASHSIGLRPKNRLVLSFAQYRELRSLYSSFGALISIGLGLLDRASLFTSTAFGLERLIASFLSEKDSGINSRIN